MKNLFDRVQENANQLAAILSFTLGIALLVSGSWALHETLDSESRVYFIIGYMSGTKRYPAQVLLEELNRTLSPYIEILKACFSISMLVGLVQIIGGLLAYKWAKTSQMRICWITSLILAALCSLVATIIPLAIGLRGFLELRIVATIAGLNAFILIHLIVFLVIDLRAMVRASSTSSNSSASTTTTTVTTNTGTSSAT